MAGRRSISAFSNPLIKDVRALRDKKGRRAQRRFLAEGLRIVTEAVDSGAVPELLVVAEDHPPHPLVEWIGRAVFDAGGEVIAVPTPLLSKLSGKDNPQSVLGVFADRTTRLPDLDRTAHPIWLVGQAIRDPGNLGTMLRTGDAVGAGGLILVDDCADPFSVEAVRASMGAVFTQAIVPCRWADFLIWLRAGPGQLVGTSLAAAADYRVPAYAPPVFILTGNESQGLPAEYEQECDLLVKMPMLGRADSLNAAVATAVMAYHVLDRIGAARFIAATDAS